LGLIGQVLYPMGLQAAPHRCFGYLGEARIALQVGQERRDLDDVVAGRPGLGQDLFDVCEHLTRLSLDVARRDGFTGGVHRDIAGDEDHPAAGGLDAL
jgi:hypothetical protein